MIENSRNLRSPAYSSPLQPLKVIFRHFSPTWWLCIPLAALIVILGEAAASSQGLEAPTNIDEVRVVLDSIFLLFCSVLVIFMNAGFGMLETGFCRQKNAVNILAKNLIVFGIATLAYWAIGYGLMYGEGNAFFGTSGFLFDVSYVAAVIIGAIAGILVVFSVSWFDNIGIDDPVGATSVHLVCGIWGTLAVGIFGSGNLMTQVIGILAIGGFTVIFSAIVWGILKATIGIRVHEADEIRGLDISEHGMEAYSGLVKEAEVFASGAYGQETDSEMSKIG